MPPKKESSISSLLLSSLNPEERKDFIDLFKRNTILRENLVKFLQTRVKEVKSFDYNCPSWSHKQADINGYNRALKEIIKVLESEPHV